MGQVETQTDWDSYAKQIPEILNTPLTASELVTKACEYFHWDPWFTRNVVAFADTKYIWYSKRKWSLQKPDNEGILTDEGYKKSTKQGAVKVKPKKKQPSKKVAAVT